MKMELGEYGMKPYLLRLVACLFLCVSLNTFSKTLYGTDYLEQGKIVSQNISTGERAIVDDQ